MNAINPYDDIVALPAQSDTVSPPIPQPGAPAANPYDDVVGQMQEARQAQAQAVTYSGSLSDPDKAARAQDLSKQLGVPAPAIEQDLPTWEQRAALYKSSTILQNNPALADYIIQHPEAARVAHDDYDNLSWMGKRVADFAGGWDQGVQGNQLGRAESAGNYAQADAIAAKLAAPDPTGAGIPGYIAKTLGGFVGGFVDMVRQPLTATTAAAGGVLGASIGGPAAPATAAVGFGAGVLAGIGADAVRVGYGQMHHNLSQQIDENGNHLDPTLVTGLSAVAGLVNGALNVFGAKAGAKPLTDEAGVLLQEAAQQALTRPTVTRALATFAAGTAKAAGQGGAIGAAMEGTNILIEQAAKELSPGDFKTIFNDPAERAAAVQRLATAMGSMALSIGAMHGSLAQFGLGRDLLAARQADRDAAGLQGLLQGAEASKVRERSGSTFMGWLSQQAAGTPVENLFIPGAKVDELYQKMGATPGENDPVFGQFVPDIAHQLEQARQTGGDVVIPTAGFITHLAGTDVANGLMPDVRVRQDGMSLNEAKTFHEAYAAAMEEQGKQAEAENAADKATRSSQQQILDDVNTQARAAGIGVEEARQIAALYAARYTARGARLGLDPLDLYRESNVTIKRDVPAYMAPEPATPLDSLLTALRLPDNRTAIGKQRQLYGPSLLEFISKRGGIEDEGGDLAAMGAGDWHKGKPGMGKLIRTPEDRGAELPGMAAGETPHSLDTTAQAAHEAGYLGAAPGREFATRGQEVERPDINTLKDAIAKELQGEPVFSHLNRDEQGIAFDGAVDDLRKTLDEAGIDPAKATNAEIKSQLDAYFKGREFNQAVEGADHVVSIARDQAATVATPEMRAHAEDYIAQLRTAGHDAVADALAETLKGFDRPFSEITDPYERALWVRFFDATQGETIDSGSINDIAKVLENGERQGQGRGESPGGAGAAGRGGPDAGLDGQQGNSGDAGQLRGGSVRAGGDANAGATGEPAGAAQGLGPREFGQGFLSRVRDRYFGRSEPPKPPGEIGVAETSPGRFDIHHNGEKIGTAGVSLGGEGNYLDHIGIDSAMQGKGYAPAIYDGIEAQLGRRLVPSPKGLSEQAEAFWNRRLAGMDARERADVLEQARMAGEAEGVHPGMLEQRLARLNGGRTFNQHAIDLSPPSMQNPAARSFTHGDTGIEYTSRQNGTIRIDMVHTLEEGRGQGSARAALQAFLNATDAAGKRTTLNIEPMERGVSTAGLRRLYESLGFQKNTGRKADHSIGDGWVREPLQLYQDGDQLRGKINLAEDGATITLFRQANRSTLLHETGHLWLDELTQDAARLDAPDQLKADMDTLLKHWGISDASEIGRDQHEDFARMTEAYLMDGKSPSAGLEGVFSRFRAWLTSIYKTVSNLGVTMSPEVREVFDRLVASDDEINAVRQRQGMRQAFASAAEAGMTDAEFAAYTKSVEAATAGAQTELLTKVMGDVRRQTTAWWKREEAPVREEVTGEVDKRPEFAALKILQGGGPPDAQGRPTRLRLSRQDVIDILGSDAGLKDLPSTVPPIVSAVGGVHPDIVAELAGFGSGEEMLYALMGVEAQRRELKAQGDNRSARQYAIDEETHARMVDRHGDVLTDGSIEEKAQDAIHNELQLQTLATELRALSRQTGINVNGQRVLVGPVTPLEVARDWARRTIAERNVRDATNVGQYSRAEAKAARAFTEAMLAGDHQAALQAKQQQMLNHALYIEARRAEEEVSRAVRMLDRLQNSDTIKSIAQRDLDAIHGLLERFDFGKASEQTLAERESLREWYERKTSEGYTPAVPEKLLDAAFTQHYSTMSVGDLRDLHTAVQSMVHIGKTRQMLQDLKEQREFDALVHEAVNQAMDLPQVEPVARRNPGVGGGGLDSLRAKVETTVHALKNMDASLLKIDQVFQWLDKKNVNGVFSRVIMRRFSEAQTREHDLQAEMTGKLKALGHAMPKANRKALSRRIEVPELPDKITGKASSLLKSEIIAIALNVGNQSNWEKLLEGEGWKPDSVRAVLDKHLDQHDWAFVQGVWDTVNHLWPQIAEMEKRINGVEPDKVEAWPVQTANHGTFAGGYYPVVYDPLRSFDAFQNQQRSSDALFENNYVKAATAKGHTINRVQNYTRPLYLSLDVLPRHLSQVIHDLAWREAIMDADKFLGDKRVRQGIEGALGREYYAQFRPWLQSIANEKTMDPRGLAFWDSVARKARTSATLVGLGFRLSTILVHGTSAALNSVGEVGMGPMVSATGTFMKDPVGSYKFVTEKSGEMRNRMNEVDRDIRDEVRGLVGQTGAMAQVRRLSMVGVGMLDMASALPTWLAHYTTTLKRGEDEATAVAAADQAVRNAHGAAAAKDHAAIQRGSETMKLFTMFYSFWNHLYNRQRDLARDAGNVRSVGDFASVLGRSFFYLLAPPIIHGLISGAGGKSDDDTWGGWAAKHIALGLVGGIPVVRDMASVFEGHDYSVTPAAGVVKSAINVGKDLGHALGMVDGDVSERWLRHVVELSGYGLGLPTGQASSTAQFLWDAMDGSEDPQGVQEWLHGLVYGPEHKG